MQMVGSLKFMWPLPTKQFLLKSTDAHVKGEQARIQQMKASAVAKDDKTMAWRQHMQQRHCTHRCAHAMQRSQLMTRQLRLKVAQVAGCGCGEKGERTSEMVSKQRADYAGVGARLRRRTTS